MCVGKRKFERKEEEEEDASNKGGTCFAFFLLTLRQAEALLGKYGMSVRNFFFLKLLDSSFLGSTFFGFLKRHFVNISTCDVMEMTFHRPYVSNAIIVSL